MKRALIIFIVINSVLAYSELIAQEVEHNYLVGPQFTNCDSLDLKGISAQESIKLIRNAKFRFDQSFKLTKKQGLQKGEFYSCDNKEGYLIIKYDAKEILLEKVQKSFWIELISSSDPEGLFIKRKKELSEIL